MLTETEILAEIERLEGLEPTGARLLQIGELTLALDEMAEEVADYEAGMYDPNDFRDLGGMGVEPR